MGGSGDAFPVMVADFVTAGVASFAVKPRRSGLFALLSTRCSRLFAKAMFPSVFGVTCVYMAYLLLDDSVWDSYSMMLRPLAYILAVLVSVSLVVRCLRDCVVCEEVLLLVRGLGVQVSRAYLSDR